MHVLEILNAYPGETFLQEHARAVATTDVQVSWAFWQTNKPGALPKVIPELKHCVGLINSNRIPKWKKMLLRLRYWNYSDPYTQALKNQVKKIKPDIIHFQFASLAMRHYKWVESLRIPFTFSVRGSDIQSEAVRSEDTLDRLKIIAKKAAGIHTVSDHLKAKLFRHVGEYKKTTTIRTVIHDHWKTVVRKPEKGNLVTIGRLHWPKSHSDLLIACHELKKWGIDVKLTIIGEGDQRQLLEYMIRDLGLSDRVQLVGKQNAAVIKGYLSGADAFVLSSIAEGFPNVVGEAAFAGVPMIATADSYVDEVLTQQHEYVRVSTGSPEALAKAILEIFEMDAIEKEAMASRAMQKSIEVFSSSQHASSFSQFWNTVLKKQGT